MYDVLDICRYTINYSNGKSYGVSNLKLQKLLYFIQAYFLISKDPSTPCFDDEIEAWDFGPVVPAAYHEYKEYGSSNIPTITSYYEIIDNPWDAKKLEYDDSNILSVDKEDINAVIDMMSEYSATDLVEITHNQSPWKNAYKPKMNNVITNEAIKEYFDDEEN